MSWPRSSDDELDVLRRMVAAVNARDAVAVGACYSLDAVLTRPAEVLIGRSSIVAHHLDLFAAFSVVRVEIRTLVRDGARFALELTGCAEHHGELYLPGGRHLAATGRTVRYAALSVGHLAAGLIAEERLYEDPGAQLRQLTAP